MYCGIGVPGAVLGICFRHSAPDIQRKATKRRCFIFHGKQRQMRQYTEQEIFRRAEHWLPRTNRLYAIAKDESQESKRRLKANKLWDMMQARILMLFAAIISNRMKSAQAQAKTQAKKRIIMPGQTLANDQKSRLFNRRFKK